MPVKLVFLPSLQYDSSLWSNISDRLKNKGFNVKLVDLPVYGFKFNEEDKNSFENLATYVESNLEKNIEYILVGHSLGGLIATIIASRKNLCIKKCIITSTPLRKIEQTYPIPYRTLVSIGYNVPSIVKTLEKFLSVSRKIPVINRSVIVKQTSYLTKGDLVSSVNCFYDLTKVDFSPYIKNCSVDFMIVYGLDDKFLIDVAKGTDLYNLFKTKTIVKLMGGHGLPNDNTEELYKTIVQYLEG